MTASVGTMELLRVHKNIPFIQQQLKTVNYPTATRIHAFSLRSCARHSVLKQLVSRYAVCNSTLRHSDKRQRSPSAKPCEHARQVLHKRTSRIHQIPFTMFRIIITRYASCIRLYQQPTNIYIHVHTIASKAARISCGNGLTELTHIQCVEGDIINIQCSVIA